MHVQKMSNESNARRVELGSFVPNAGQCLLRRFQLITEKALSADELFGNKATFMPNVNLNASLNYIPLLRKSRWTIFQRDGDLTGYE